MSAADLFDSDTLPDPPEPTGPDPSWTWHYADLPLIYVEPRGKAPKPGFRFTGSLPQPSEVLAWVRDGGNAGVRLDGRVVLDFDPRNAERSHAETMAEVATRLGGFDPRASLTTWTAGGGAHHYLAADAAQVRALRELLRDIPGLDIKAGGGAQVVAPGSLHPNGRHYRGDARLQVARALHALGEPWREGGDPREAPPKAADLILALPPAESWAQWSAADRTRTAPEPAAPTSSSAPTVERDLRDYLGRERILALLDRAEADRLFGDNDTWFRLMAGLAFACHGQPWSREVCERFFQWCGHHPDYAGEEGARRLLNDMARWDGLGAKLDERASAGTAVKILTEIAASDGPEPAAAPAATPAPACTFLALPDFLATVKPAPPIVEGLIYGSGSVVLFGPWGLGKTYAALDLAWHVAAGRPDWHGRKLYTSGVVAYLACEGQYALPNRLRALAQHYGAPERGSVRSPDAALYIRPGGIDLGDADQRSAVWAEIAALGPKLVILDTLSAAIPGADENAAQDVGQIIAFLNGLAARTGAAVLAIHHSAKHDAESARGSGTIEANTDTVLRIARDGAGFAIHAKKIRASAPATPLRLRLATVVLGEDPEHPGRIVQDAVLVRSEPEGPPAVDAVLTELVPVGGRVARKAAVERVCERLGWGETRAEAAIDAAAPEGRDAADGMTGLYRERGGPGGRRDAWWIRRTAPH